MRAISWNSQTAYLIDERPNFSLPYELGASVATVSSRSLSGIEERRSLGNSLKLSLRFSVLLDGADQVTAWRNAQQAMSTEAVLVPLWVAKRAPGAFHPLNGPWWAVYQSGSAVQVYDTASIPGGLPADAWVVPLLVGILTQWPEPQHITSELAAVDVFFEENSNDDFITLTAYTPPTGLTVSGITPSLFPWRPNQATVPRGQAAQVAIDRQSVGQGRASSDTYWAQLSSRSEFRAFTLSDDEPWQFLRYFLDLRAGRGSFWLPGSSAEARLTAGVSTGNTVLNVDSPANRGANAFVLLDDRTTRHPNKVTSTSGSTWVLASAVPSDFNVDATQIFPLQLSRISGSQVSLKFEHDTLAETQLRFVEVPWETISPGGESVGITFGALPDSAYLYLFTIAIPGNLRSFFYTDNAQPITYDGSTYNPKGIEHGSIRLALGLDRQQVQIKCRTFNLNPLNQMLPFSLEYPLMLEISEVDVVAGAATNVRRVFYGEVTNCSSVGPIMTATAKSFGSMFDRKIPRLLIQPTCNFSLYDTGCGISRASLQHDALLGTWNSATGVLVVNTVTLASVAVTAAPIHYFANGIVEVGTGASRQQRWIADSLAQSGSNIQLTLSSSFVGTWAAGSTIKIWPGCDGRYETCSGKFANAQQFGGFPFTPIGNPSLIRVSKNLSVGGKK